MIDPYDLFLIVIEQVQSCEIEDEINEELGFEFDGETHLQYKIKPKDKYFNFNGGCNIDTIIETLTSMKAKGATHVYCDFHEDHQSIIIDSFNVRKATDVETQDEQKRLDLIEHEQAEIKRLRDKISEHQDKIKAF